MAKKKKVIQSSAPTGTGQGRKPGRISPERWGGPMRAKQWLMPLPWMKALMDYIDSVLDSGEVITARFALYQILQKTMEIRGFPYKYDESLRDQSTYPVKGAAGRGGRRASSVPKGETAQLKVSWPDGFSTQFESWADSEISKGNALSEKDLVYRYVGAFLRSKGFKTE